VGLGRGGGVAAGNGVGFEVWRPYWAWPGRDLRGPWVFRGCVLRPRLDTLQPVPPLFFVFVLGLLGIDPVASSPVCVGGPRSSLGASDAGWLFQGRVPRLACARRGRQHVLGYSCFRGCGLSLRPSQLRWC
jgi:hypothetical protein